MTARDRDAMVWRVLAALGIEDADLLPLGAGLASEAWRVGSVPTWYALRIARQWPDADSTFEMEHALMSLLADAGARVPAPLRGSWQVADWSGPPFSLTLGLDGAPLARADRARAVPGIAAFLRTLHGLTIDGYGPLTMVHGRLAGAATDMTAGLGRWAMRPLWPLGGALLAAHPALAERPDLVARLEPHADRIREALLRGPGAPLHSDLHDENILDDDGVPGFIDFGEALIGPAAWEFAALAYFLDWPTADAILAAYLDDGQLVDPWSRDTAAIGLCFGVYRWAQDRELDVDEDAHDEAFLVETLSRM
jgi:Ser/Thr protein kinase RdoA (MazF antagonist)